MLKLSKQNNKEKFMGYVTNTGWKNKKGTSVRSCNCGTWKQHWINYSEKTWPEICSVEGCTNKATLGAHIYNSKVTSEKIVPACDSCNKRDEAFDLKSGVTLVPANKQKTCEK